MKRASSAFDQVAGGRVGSAVLASGTATLTVDVIVIGGGEAGVVVGVATTVIVGWAVDGDDAG